jgi:hypothetical protein
MENEECRMKSVKWRMENIEGMQQEERQMEFIIFHSTFCIYLKGVYHE